MPQTPLSLGISPCPNDTYIFEAWVRGRTPGPNVNVELHDVETLNAMAARGAPDVVKLSVAACAGVLDEYALLDCGGALGRGCGPLVVARNALGPEELSGKRMAIPGRMTTANLLLTLTGLHTGERVEMGYERVMDTVVMGEVDAGVIIHEGRFSYAARGLKLVLDLGAWWEAETGLPIPLGAIAVRRSLGPEVATRVGAAIRASLAHARSHPDDAWPWIVEHAQEMSPKVIREHIATFVTDFSERLGPEGRDAVARLVAAAAAEAGTTLPDVPLFAGQEA